VRVRNASKEISTLKKAFDNRHLWIIQQEKEINRRKRFLIAEEEDSAVAQKRSAQSSKISACYICLTEFANGVHSCGCAVICLIY
jgi:hypothetical protein